MASATPVAAAEAAPYARGVAPSPDANAIVVGAGLAGLVASRTLTRAGLKVLLLEASDDVGGRVRTDVVDGFLLDRGFQLYNTAYPEGVRQLDHRALRLCGFTRGIVLNHKGHPVSLADPRDVPGWILNVFRAPLGSLHERLSLARYLRSCTATSPRELVRQRDVSAVDALRAAGIAPEAIDHLFRPFLSGVFLEPDLQSSRRFLDLVLRTFVTGVPSVPSGGMQQIPRQLASALPTGVVRFRCPVREVAPRQVVTDDGPMHARVVVVATDPRSASQLLPPVDLPRMRGVTTWYHATDDLGLAGGRPVLHVDGDGSGPVANSVVISHAAPAYAPAGKSLVASSVLGTEGPAEDETAVLRHLALLYRTDTKFWETVGVSRIPDALPTMMPPHDFQQPVQLGDGLFVAGDHRDSSSIQGALVSGRRTAHAVLSHLGPSKD